MPTYVEALTHLLVDPERCARWPSRHSDDVVELALELAFDEPTQRERALGGGAGRAVLLDFRRVTRTGKTDGHGAVEGPDDTISATLAAFLHLTRDAEVKTAVVVPIGLHGPTLRQLSATRRTGVAVFENEGDALAWLAT